MKEYITAKELQELIGTGYQSAMKIIDEVRDEMKNKNYLIPKCRKKVALKKLVEKRLGLK
jgi:hypothetical protein